MRRSPTTYRKPESTTHNQGSPAAHGYTSMYMVSLDQGRTSRVGAAAKIEGRSSWSR